MRLMRGDATDAPAQTLYTQHPIPGYEKVFDTQHDAAIRFGFGRMVEADPMRRRNRVMLLHGRLISGRPAFDFTNPYAFLSRLYINKPTLRLGTLGGHETPQAISANILAGNMQLTKRW